MSSTNFGAIKISTSYLPGIECARCLPETQRRLRSEYVLSVFLCTLDTVSAQTIEVVPNRVLFDESAAIHLTGLQPKEQISIQAELKDNVIPFPAKKSISADRLRAMRCPRSRQLQRCWVFWIAT
jgi:hypothetical protein